jgi:formylglycine-generating enzyme required for sulfatase activity
MNRWIVVLSVSLAGCEGERVESSLADAQVSDVGSQETGDAPITGDCGSYKGAKMVRVGSFCIDTTEVTRGQFLEFLAAPTEDRNAAKPADCAWNTTDPTINTTSDLRGLPVDDVNFCDAMAYCAWANKRLCGKIGGGPNAPEDFNNQAKSEWFSVCSPDGVQTYPYGKDYIAARCFTLEATLEATGSRTGCAGTAKPYSEVFDLSGNVFEWENSCTASPKSTTTRCRTRGGGNMSGTTATCAKDDLTNVDTRLAGFGFRCCRD